jgi:hypothetical protein
MTEVATSCGARVTPTFIYSTLRLRSLFKYISPAFNENRKHNQPPNSAISIFFTLSVDLLGVNRFRSADRQCIRRNICKWIVRVCIHATRGPQHLTPSDLKSSNFRDIFTVTT